MRHQLLKQKQAIAHKTIQPLARLMSIKTDGDHQRAENASILQVVLHTKSANDEEDQSSLQRSTNQRKLQSTGTIFHRAAREKQRNIPSLGNRGLNRSEKLVGRDPIMTIQHTDRAERPSITLQKIEEEKISRHYKKEEHIQHLMRVNQNLRNLQGKNNAILLRSIELLRSNEKYYLPDIQTEEQSQNIRKDESLTFLSTLEANQLPETIEEATEDGERRSSIFRTIKEEAALRFKQKIKVKQSRRHIYRTLKNKNDALNKIKLKTHHSTPNKDRPNPEIKQIQELRLIRVHCPQGKQNSCNVRSSNFRSLTKTYYENMREIRAETKQNSLQDKPAFELRTTKCQFLSNDIEALSHAYKKKSGMEAYEQIALRLKKNQQIPPKPQKDQTDSKNNVFRQLTPWHFQQH